MTYSFDFLGVTQLNAQVSEFLIRATDIDAMHRGGLKAFFKIEQKQFKSEGGAHPWQPLSAKYESWKDKQTFFNKKIMQLTGSLKNALTGKDKSAFKVQVTGPESVQLVIYSQYWHNHQYGTTVPVRRTVDLTDEDGAYIVSSMLKATLGGRLSRLFTRSN